jgi:hypothetical protein
MTDVKKLILARMREDQTLYEVRIPQDQGEFLYTTRFEDATIMAAEYAKCCKIAIVGYDKKEMIVGKWAVHQKVEVVWGLASTCVDRVD